MRCHDDLVEFVLDALATDDLNPLCHPFQSHPGLILDLEVQLRRKTDTAHHTQGVVREGDVRL